MLSTRTLVLTMSDGITTVTKGMENPNSSSQLQYLALKFTMRYFVQNLAALIQGIGVSKGRQIHSLSLSSFKMAAQSDH